MRRLRSMVVGAGPAARAGQSPIGRRKRPRRGRGEELRQTVFCGASWRFQGALATALLPQPGGFEGLRPLKEGSGVRYDLAHLDVFERDCVGNYRWHPLAHVRGGFLGLEDDHRQARAVVRPCPVPGYEPWGLRYAGYDVLAQLARGGLSVVDRDPDYDCVHGCLLLSLGGRTLSGSQRRDRRSSLSRDIARAVSRGQPVGIGANSRCLTASNQAVVTTKLGSSRRPSEIRIHQAASAPLLGRDHVAGGGYSRSPAASRAWSWSRKARRLVIVAFATKKTNQPR